MKPLNQWTPSDITDLLKRVDKKTWIKIGIGAAVFLVLFFLVISPAWFQRLQVRSQIAVVKGQIITVENLSRKKPEWLRDQADFKKFIDDVKGRIFLPGETSLLLGAIAKLADESKVNIIASRPKDFLEKLPPPFDEQYEGNLYDFTVEGGYHALGTFISKIEANPKVLRIQLCHVNPREASPDSHVASISLSAMSFKKGKS